MDCRVRLSSRFMETQVPVENNQDYRHTGDKIRLKAYQMKIIILYHFEVKILLLLLLLNHNYEEFKSLFIAELDIQAWFQLKGHNLHDLPFRGIETMYTLLLNIVGLRLNDFEREVRDSELLLFFPSFIKCSILSDIFSIFSSLKKTFSTIFCSFLKCSSD